MARRYVFQNSLAAGELAPSYLMRTDAQARNEGAKTAANVMLRPGGGWTRRWGTVDLGALPADARLETLGIGTDDAKVLVFAAGVFEVRNLAGVMERHVIAAVPWVDEDVLPMQVAIEDGRVVVASQSFRPQELTRDPDTGIWSIANFAFASGLNGATQQPYWRYHDKGVALTVSAYGGSVTLQTSADFFDPLHVGTKIRYAGVEISVTAVTDAQHAAGTVVGLLYPTVSCSVASSAGFLAGQVVEGLDSQTQGVVVTIPDGTHITVQLLDGYTAFDWTPADGDNPAVGEDIVSPTAKTSQTAQATQVSTPAPTVEWDEQMVSPVRGYPGACGFHRARLLLGDFPQARNAFAASTTDDPTDFDVGTGLDTDAIVELVGRETTLGVKHFGSAEQLLIFTESGPYYVPEQVGAPLSPTNFELLSISPEAAGAPTPVKIAEGMLFTEEGSGRVMAVLPTGNVRRSWDITDLSELGYHLMGEPRQLRLLPAGTQSDRLVCLLKRDGDIAALTYRRQNTFAAWVNWTTVGSWRSIVVAGGALYAVARRNINGVLTYRLEKFSPDALADGTVTIADTSVLVPQFAGETVGVWSGQTKLGEFDVDVTGAIQGVSDAFTGPFDVGFDFTVEVDLVPPVDSAMGLRQKIRICRVDVDAIESGPFTVNGFDPSGFPSTGEFGGGVSVTTDVRRFRTLGRSQDATARIKQTVGAPLEVRTITMEVTS